MLGSGIGKDIIIFGAEMSSSVHVDNIKDISILDEGSMQRLDDTILTVEKIYLVNFAKHNKKFCLSLHYNGVNSYLIFNRAEIIEIIKKVFIAAMTFVAVPLKCVSMSHQECRVRAAIMNINSNEPVFYP